MASCCTRWLPEQLDPISIFLVTSGSTGDKLLFRYPLAGDRGPAGAQPSNVFSSPSRSGSSACPHQFSLRQLDAVPDPEHSAMSLLRLDKGADVTVCLLDETLASILSAKAVMSTKSFEIKIDDVVFLGYSETVDQSADSREQRTSISTFSIIFAVRCGAPKSINKQYIQLAKQITTALRHEEQRCQFLTKQEEQIHHLLSDTDECDKRWQQLERVAQRSQLCRSLAQVFCQLRDSGRVRLRLNGWVPISHCLAHKMHRLAGHCYVPPDTVQASLRRLRPYHCLLLLHDPATIGASLDCNPTLFRFLRSLSPDKSLQEARLDADVTYAAAVRMARHLVLWGFAIVTCPVADTNMYVLNPRMESLLAETPRLAEDYARQCAAYGQQPLPCLAELLAAFSLHSPLGDLRDREPAADLPLGLMTWLLQRRLLLQLHTHVFFVLPDADCGAGEGEEAGGQLPQLPSRLKDRLDEAGQLAVQRVPHADSAVDLDLFADLLDCVEPDGCHIEHLVHYLDRSRSEIVTLVDKFQPVLVTTLLPDTASQVFFGCS